MANLAANKLPLEKDNWKRPEIATNGIINKYDGANGYAHANWPCVFTIDLENEMRISFIRFLLWDGLGTSQKEKDIRKYTFTLSISSDGYNYFDIFSNKADSGENGWFSFKLLNETYARFVRLTGHYNTKNIAFHLIEFEIHDSEPYSINSPNIHNYDIVTGIPSEKLINNLIDRAISLKSTVFEGIESKLDKLNIAISRSDEAFDQIELIKQSTGFMEESESNKKRAQNWIYASIGCFSIFICLLGYFIFCDDHSKSIITESEKDESLKQFTIYLLSAYYATKAVIISTFIFILSWFLKNYRSERHNYIVNKHKAMSITMAIAVLTKSEYKNVNKSVVFEEAMNIILSHQTSGFSKEENSSSNIINSVLPKETQRIVP
ncbi:MAG: hypothetical protein A2W91_09935 [Bacteroidetes bacterium GWF2_38_335]|nr:MAG: hypothetical protein A2W91_09935 [Bacteroidetes bacterium GWF2_38_335]HBS88053.1 hypothetical protein [Bacteroidales bacterium]